MIHKLFCIIFWYTVLGSGLGYINWHFKLAIIVLSVLLLFPLLWPNGEPPKHITNYNYQRFIAIVKPVKEITAPFCGKSLDRMKGLLTDWN